MKRLLISVAMVGALAGTTALAQAGTDYPPCKTRDQDHCTVAGGAMHKAVKHHAKKAAKPVATPPASGN